ncbi:MAG: magnesium chelatase [Marinilabiliales bacterium]|nr:MAG: magnesium chelatase [Marinilabiliales bacterium]
MIVKTNACALHGIDAFIVSVEVDASKGLGTFMAGLPDNAVKESRSRIEPALKNSGFFYPGKKITINLAPADIKKEGTSYDLAIALGILSASGQIDRQDFSDCIIIGELSLDGSILPVSGALSICIEARNRGYKSIILPSDNIQEASVVEGIDVYGFSVLSDLCLFLDDKETTEPIKPTISERTQDEFKNLLDFADVKGQENVKRAIEIAAAGGHNALMIGSPGSGKTMLAKRIPGILPSMTLDEALESTKIHSVAGKLGSNRGLLQERPFRSPHHTISDVALVGGGTYPQPGEISLAHNGVLFLDELPEFKRSVLEVMRQPLEDRIVTISRARLSVDYPASIMLVAAMNPCPCGYYNHPKKECTCIPGAVRKYLSRISGPLLDRIDIHVEVVPVPINDLSAMKKGESSAEVRKRVIFAREIQLKRFAGQDNLYCNAQIASNQLDSYCRLDEQGSRMLSNAMEKLSLSARAYDRIRKVARTIADLDNSTDIQNHHLAEAIQYRSLDRETWGV